MAKAANWDTPDAEARERGERTGLDTRVVHAVNDVDSVCGARKRAVCLSSREKSTAWGLRAQA